MTTALDPTSNGHARGEEPSRGGDDADAGSDPDAYPAHRGGALSALRQRPVNVHILRGYGPLVVGAVLFVLMVLLAPTVAPERVVERPVDAPAVTTTTTLTAGTTTVEVAP